MSFGQIVKQFRAMSREHLAVTGRTTTVYLAPQNASQVTTRLNVVNAQTVTINLFTLESLVEQIYLIGST